MKNNLEAYSYNMRTDLDAQGGVLREYVDPAIIEAYLVEINQIVDWLYEDEGKNAAKDVYLTKYNSLRKIGDPAKLRKKYFEEVEPQFVQFEKLSQNVNNQFANLTHMTDEDSQNLVKHYQTCAEFIETAKAVLSQPKHLPHDITVEAVQQKISAYEYEANRILSKPAPKKEEPKKEEPKKEEEKKEEEKKQEASVDTEMKDETEKKSEL